MAWRRWARTLALPSRSVVEAVGAEVAAFLRGIDGVVMGYVALADEIDVASALSSVAPGQLALPRLGDDATMTTHLDHGAREGHRLGFSQPRADSPIVRPDELAAVVVPGRIFDVRGYRLGRGGGHYDRLVPLLASDVPVIGVAADEGIVDSLPVEAHDRPMTHVVTQTGVHAVGR